jgi:hypothetical protein
MVDSWQRVVVRPAGVARSARNIPVITYMSRHPSAEGNGASSLTAEHAEDAEHDRVVLGVVSVLSGESAEPRVR